MTFYLLLSLLLLRTVRLAPYALILVLCISAGGGVLVDIRRPIWIIFCNPILLEFVLGVVIALVYKRVGTRPQLGTLLTLTGTGLALFWECADRPSIAHGMQMIVTNVGVFARVATFGMAAFLIVGGVVLWGPGMKGFLSRTLVILGNASYSTYLISSIAIELGLRILLAVHSPNSVPVALFYTLTCIAIILGLGWLFYDFVEWPLLRFLQRKLPR
jgi:peptidoglycan/LPS O-acetylase OafA/YrhL